MNDNPYVSIERWGNCKVCGKHDDLRFGSCFKCSDHVAGERISPTTHRLWDSRNPSNEWSASESGDAMEEKRRPAEDIIFVRRVLGLCPGETLSQEEIRSARRLTKTDFWRNCLCVFGERYLENITAAIKADREGR